MKKANKNTEQASQDEGKLIRIEVADPAHGHQTLMLKPEDTQEFLSNHTDKWVFVDNEFMQPQNLSTVNWNTTVTVRLLPGLIGGLSVKSSPIVKFTTDIEG